MTGNKLRKTYLEYFRHEGHEVVPSSSLVPEDPTLLFTSAGMVQFKEIFWGKVPPRHPRATTCQKCMRTTDIERVGTTAYHHTFFEMLGNFSFGDYFKQGAITLAWKFLTSTLGLDPARLWVSVYEADDEAFDIWVDEVGLPRERVVRLGKEHNWWGPVGDRGPCGPDSEIFWDWGASLACGTGCEGPACDCARFSEIWNLVFMQYDAQPDGSLADLGRKGIDTGMGLERTAAVLQGVMSDFDTDLFAPLVQAVENLAGAPCQGEACVPRNVLADHIRALVFLTADGVLPGNEAQGYVFRRLLRRAIRAADRIELPEGGLAQLVPPVVECFGAAYPEVVDRRALAEQVIAHEERAFRRTLRSGERRLRDALEEVAQGQRLPGEVVFELYDTYGFPVELTEEIAAETGMSVDREGFERAMERQRARSRGTADTGPSLTEAKVAEALTETTFVGYDRLTVDTQLAAIADPQGDPSTEVGEGAWHFVFPETPFYPEGGGQTADTGWVTNLDREGRAEVVDVQRSSRGTFHHVQVVAGAFRQGDRCKLDVDAERRRAVERAHTATHLLHAALRKTAGEHAIQAGSWVGPEEFRFDFTHFAPLTDEQWSQLEALAFGPVIRDLELRVRNMPLADALAAGVIAHFEEEYRGKEHVRVVEVPGVSAELCGGTHVRRTGEIGPLVILNEEAVAAGTRRIRALVGEKARRQLATIRDERAALARLLGVPEGEVAQALERSLEELREARRHASALEERLVSVDADSLCRAAEDVDGVRLVGTVIDGGADRAKQLADAVAAKLGRCAVILGSSSGGRAVIVAKVNDVPDLSAGDLVRVAAQAVGGKGGGRPTFAQGGGPKADALPDAVRDALAHARASLRSA